MEHNGTQCLVFKSSLCTIHVHNGTMCTTLKRYPSSSSINTALVSIDYYCWQYQGESDLLNVTYNLSQLYQQNSAESLLSL